MQRRQRRNLQSVLKVCLQSCVIRDEPCLHAGGHEQNLFIKRSRRPGPMIAHKQVLPCGFHVRRRFFTVYPQGPEISKFPPIQCNLESLESRPSPPPPPTPGPPPSQTPIF